MESTGRAPTLPLELGHISDTRREQLESRRQREMARQQEQSQPPGADSFRWSPMAMIPAHLCVLLFLVFLLEKLEDRIDWPWAAVLSPLWITDAVFIAIKVSLLCTGICLDCYILHRVFSYQRIITSCYQQRLRARCFPVSPSVLYFKLNNDSSGFSRRLFAV